MSGGIMINTSVLKELVNGGAISMDVLEQLILTGAYTASPNIATMNYIWNSDKVGDLLSTLIPDKSDLFTPLKTLDGVLENVEARGIIINNAGVIETLMSQFGIKDRFIKNIDIVIEMLKSDIAKDFILSDENAVKQILNSPEDFNKFFDEYKSDEHMRFNILNSNYPYLKEKLNSNQDVLTYYMNYSNQDNYLVFNQIFSDTDALKNTVVKSGLQYSYLEFCFILQNMEFFKYICDTGVVAGYIKSSDERICALICNMKQTSDLVFASADFCDRLYQNDKMFEKILLSKIACDSLCNSEVALNKLFADEVIYSKFLQSKIAEDSLFNSELASKKAFAVENLRNKIFTVSNLKQYERILEYKSACDAMFDTKEICDLVFADEALFTKVLEKELVYTLLFNHRTGCDTAFNLATVYNKIFASEDLCTTLFKNQVACDSLYAIPDTLGIVFTNNLASSCLFSSEIACDRLFLLSEMCTKLFENSVAYNNLFKSPIAYNKMFDSRIACTALYANTNATDNLLFNTAIKDLAFNNEVSADCLLDSDVSNIKVFTSSKLSNILASSEISLDLLFSKPEVFTKACGQKIACDKLFDSPISTKKIFLRADLCDVIFKSSIACDSMFANLETCENLFNSRVACDTLFANKIAYDKAFANKAVCDIMFASEIAIDSLFASDLAFTAVLASANSSDCMFNSALASDKIFQSGIITNKIFASTQAVGRLLNSTIGSDALLNSESAFNLLYTNNTVRKRALESTPFCKRIVNNSKKNSIIDRIAQDRTTVLKELLESPAFAIFVADLPTLNYMFSNSVIYTDFFNNAKTFKTIANNDSAIDVITRNKNTDLQNNKKNIFRAVKNAGSGMTQQKKATEDTVSELNLLCNERGQLIFASLQSYGSADSNKKTTLTHKNGTVAAVGHLSQSSNLTESNLNGISFYGCKFAENGDGFATIEIYK